MNCISRDKAQYAAAILAGIIGSYLWGQLKAQKIESPVSSFELFYVLFSTMAALIVSWIGTNAPWRWIFVLILSSYLSGFAFIQFWGQLGPFDLIFMAAYAAPCFLISYAIVYLQKRFRKVKGTPST